MNEKWKKYLFELSMYDHVPFIKEKQHMTLLKSLAHLT